MSKKSNIYKALIGGYNGSGNPLCQPPSPILTALLNGGGGSGSGSSGGEPADYQSVKTSVAQNASNISQLQQSQTAQETSINALQQSQTAQNTSITQNASNINDLRQDLSDLQGLQTAQETSINALQQQIEDLRDGSTPAGVEYPLTVGLTTAGGAFATDVALNYSNTIEVCAATFDGKQSCPVGRRNDNASSTLPRTELKFLGGSKKIQWQWHENVEFPSKDAAAFPELNQDIIQPRVWRFSKNLIQCFDLQGKVKGQYAKVAVNLSGVFEQYPLCLFGDTPDNSDYRHCVIWWVKIYNENNNLIANLVPAQDGNGVWGFLNTVTGYFFTNNNLTPFQAT